MCPPAGEADCGRPLSIAIVCFINDPFDEPGGKRIGGGHLVLRELAEYLVCRGFDVTLVTRLNSPAKQTFQSFGPLFRIHRLPVGPASEMSPAAVGFMIDELELSAAQVLENIEGLVALHSQYWIGGEVCRRINLRLKLRHVHHMLSFGRQKRQRGEASSPSDLLRERCEIAVANAVDIIVAQCPSEARDLMAYYPELDHRRIVVIPHGIDVDAFCNR